MFERFARGWELVKQSWHVLKKDKELMLFPILSSLACIIVTASFILPIFVAPDAIGPWFERLFGQKGTTLDYVIGIGILFLFYFLTYFMIIFFNCALAACAIIRYKGGDPTLGDGLRASVARLPQIFAWTFVAATVGLILQQIEQRSEGIGRFVVGLIGAAWSVVTYLVIPVLVVEKVGPIDALKRSATLVKDTWGESLAGNVSMGFIGFLVSIPGAVLIVVGVMMLNQLQPVGWVAVVLGIAWVLATSVLFATLKQIFLAGVYVYAADGKVPDGFEEDSLKSTFRSKDA